MATERSKFWQIGLPVLLIIALFILIYAVMQNEELDEQRANTTNQTVTVTDTERNDFNRDIEEQLAGTQAKIEELGGEIENLGDAATQEMRDALQALQDQREVLAVKLQQAKQISAEAWAEFKADINVGIEQLQAAARDLGAKIDANI